jgi:ATP-dependent exoDNAse (exonuclease V) beta subunit
MKRPDGDPASRLTVCPGLHTFDSPPPGADLDRGVPAPHDVVWWAPSDLALGAQASFGLRRDDLIVKDVPAAVVLRYKADYENWRAQRAASALIAGQASVVLRTATEAAESIGAAVTEVVPVIVETVVEGVDRPGGVRFGALVHAVLSDVALTGAADGDLADLAEIHGRLLGAEPSEVAAAREVVVRTLAHPVMQAARRAASAAACYREAPVTLRLDDGSLVEGHVDLAFEDEGGFTVVDFKTDRELEGATDRYRRQVQIYAAAIARATGKRARGILMKI